mgnify:CR=1 FL=1
MSKTSQPLHSKIININGEKDSIKIEASLKWTDTYHESVKSYTNNIPQRDGGTHLAGFRAALTRVLSKYVKENRIDLRETVYDFPKQNVITRDNIVTEINALIYFQIMDPVRAVYEIANLPQAIEKLTQTTLRNVIGEMDLDDTLSSRDTINTKLQEILDDATNKWGVKVNRVELQDINPPMDIREAMEKQMRAERDKRATILEAEGFKQSEVLKAEGDRQAEINRAEGEATARITVANAEAEALKVVTEAIRESSGDPVNYLIAMKYLETLKEMTSGEDNKVVYVPYEATGVLSSVGGIKDLLVTKGS